MKFVLLLAVAVMASAMQGHRPNNKKIPGQYIIRLDENIFKTKAQVHEFSEKIEEMYKIYGVRITELGKLKFLYVKGEHQNVMKAENMPGVKYVVQNERVSIAQGECVSHPHPGVWGLDRTDQREPLPYSNPFGSDGDYIWGDATGASTVAYVADTGIDIAHSQFDGRATWGFTAPGIPNDGDQNGHGTHCAGTIGARDYGLAKDVQLVAVKVLGDSGSGDWQYSIDGLAWITEQHNSRGGAGVAKSVVNMSLGGFGYTPIDDAVAETVANGVVVVVAAGNSDADACFYSPARAPDAVTVGATDITDTSAWFTNYGGCVDIFAPGVDVLSTVPGESTDYYSGTSMAAPHVAGVVARYQDSQASAPLPADVDAWLKSVGTPDAISWYSDSHSSSPNVLLYGEC